MKRLKSILALLLLGASFSFLFSILALRDPPWVAAWEGRLIDAFFQQRGPIEPRDDIVILGINSESMEFSEEEVEKYPDLDLFSDWPWPRETHALLLERLVDAGARVVAFDILFTNPSLYGEQDDAFFREALSQYRDRVAIGCDFSNVDSGSRRAQLVMPANSVAPDEFLTDVAGLVTYPPDSDGVVRRALFQTTSAVASRSSPVPLAGEETLWSFPAMVAKKVDETISVPGWDRAPLIRFSGPPRTYSHFPVFRVFHDRYWERGFEGGEFFRDKIVLVGATAAFMHDMHETPFGTMAGVEIHANSIDMLLDGDYLWEVSFWGQLALIFLAGVVIAPAILIWRGPYLVKFILLIGAGIGGLVLSHFLFHTSGVVAAFPLPYIALFATGFFGLAGQFTLEQAEKRRLRRTFATFVSPDVAEYLVEHPEEYEEVASGKRRHCVILFSDVRGFTSLTEQAESAEAFVHQLNEYLSAWVECVFAHKGTLDKFVGDAVMAVWGGIQSQGAKEDALSAVRAALDMRVELERLNVKWKAEGRPEFRIGVGISAGEAMVGNMGSPGRKLEFTVIGDAVNVAARLEGETKNYGRDMLVSEEVQSLVDKEIDAECLAEAAVRGRKRPVKVYAVRGARS